MFVPFESDLLKLPSHFFGHQIFPIWFEDTFDACSSLIEGDEVVSVFVTYVYGSFHLHEQLKNDNIFYKDIHNGYTVLT